MAVPVSGLACLAENEGPHERAHKLPNPLRVALRFGDDVRRRQQQQLATANGLTKFNRQQLVPIHRIVLGGHSAAQQPETNFSKIHKNIS